VTVRHYTSRAGDPHRHLHLQLNARVYAAGKWRGLHTVGVRDSLGAINGIGHAAVASDPQFRSALAAHGYTLNADGEIRQFLDYVGPFSARAAQIPEIRTDTKGIGPPRIPTKHRGQRCAGAGTRAPGPRTARTRSHHKPAAT